MSRRVIIGLLVAASGCLGDGGGDAVSTRALASVTVNWMNVMRVSAVDNALTKTAPEIQWNAGAASVETIPGDGFTEFTTGESTTVKMIGLSNGDAGQSFTDIDFAVSFKGGGSVDIVEAGVLRASNVATYIAGDLFRVQVLAGVVTYWKNGVLLYTSAAAPTFPLGVDTALRTPGATLQNVYLEDLAFWTNVVGAQALANDLSKTAPENEYDAGASSLAALDGDGYAEFTTGETTTDKEAGLNRADRNQGIRDIDFGILLRKNGAFAVREKGGNPAGVLGSYQAGDLFRIESSGGVVTYARNGVVFYTSAVAPSRRLVFDTSLRTPGATILDARLLPAGECSLPTQILAQPEASRPSVAAAADGDRLVVSYLPQSPFQSRLGPTSVYRRLPSGWIREQVLVEGVAHGNTRPGGVAIDGDTIAIGNRMDGADSDGSIRVFEQDGSQWDETAYFEGCPQLYNGEDFGVSVAVQGDLMAVGNGRDRVYIYRRTGTDWTWEAWLEPSSDPSLLFFARRVAVGGDRVFVSWSSANGGAGGIYAYRFDAALPDPPPPFCNTPRPGKWVLETVLPSPNPQVGDNFPSSLAVNASGTLLLAGNPQVGLEDPDTEQPIPNGPGEAYVFELTPGGWAASATLVGSSAELDAQFGYSVAWSGPDPDAPSFAVIGAPFQGPGNENFGGAPGGAYLFWNDEGTWTEVSRLLWPGPLTSVQYGGAAAASTDTAFVYQTGGPSPGDSGANITIHDVATCEL